ncbi:DUF4153 domain-containing protein [Clostridium sp. WILCCON 0269]|uniref:DUF4153 domain-containing protein n=1 Tax=Candidatus Clostridium eludens TaxID=3381663 RepID=A0ABW8SLK0_9CLOT
MRLVNCIKNLLTGLYSSFKRFPLTILFSASVALVLIIISEINPGNNTLNRIVLVLALGIPVSLCIKLFLERKGWEDKCKISVVSCACGMLFLVLYYFLFLKNTEMVSITRYFAVSLSLYMGFLFIPYFLKKEQFEMYVIIVFTSFFITIIYSIVLYLGLSAILFTINKLLEIKISGKIYYYTWLLVVFIFSMSYFLSGVPSKHKEMSVKSYPKLFKILLLYIVMPLLTAYTIILYIYFGKIIVTRHWPVGMVSNLVLWYSIIVTMVLFFITPIKDENSWQNRFLKFCPKIILPLIIMMFISLSIRINAYGVTENRYFVAILGIWVFFVMIYLSFIKKIRNIMIPITLSIVSLISVFGPLSSYSISKMNQNNRFEKILIKNNMIRDRKIQINPNISTEDKSKINSILDYFNKNHSFKEIKYLPQDFNLDHMKDVFGFSFTSPNYGSNEEYFNFTRKEDHQSINISGYDYLFDMSSISSTGNPPNSNLTVWYDYETSIIKMNYKGNEIYTKNLNNFTNNLGKKHSTLSRENSLSPEEMTLVDENQKIKVKFIFLNISGNKNTLDETIKTNRVDFYVLVKMK